MSIGPGRIQTAIIDIFTRHPALRLSVQELALIVFPDEEISAAHTGRISRALNSTALKRKITLHRCHVGNRRTGGWHYVYGKTD